MTTICGIHNHATVGEAGACPVCRQTAIDLLADGPHGFVLWFPDTEQVAITRSWIPDDPLTDAWAAGCNTGGDVGWATLNTSTIESAGVELFTLLSGADATSALASLGFDKTPWDDLTIGICRCDGLVVVDPDDKDES